MKIQVKGIALLLALILLFTGQITAFTASDQTSAVIEDTASYIHQTVKSPRVNSVGGEWAVLGLARSGYDVPDSYYEGYYKTVEIYVKAAKGVLHDKKYTEYSRVIIALTAAGYDPTNVGGYDLTMALGDYEKTIWQGINGPIFALIAMDSGNYAIPKNSGAAVQATRTMYVDEILGRQLPDGGFSLFEGSEDATEADYQADPDITSMALQALAKYQDRADVKRITEEALTCLSKLQNNQGGYASWGEDNVESVAQVIVALTELGIPLDDPRFVKNGRTLLDNLLTFYVKGQGFRHTASGGGNNQMATEQAFYALVAIQRVREGKSSLYRMKDTTAAEALKAEEGGKTKGLPGKHADVKVVAPVYPGRTFTDISTHANKLAVEALSERGIVNGKTEKLYEPDTTMTREEFAAIVVRGLGLPGESGYGSYTAAANDYGIITGSASEGFNPERVITREEAAVMTARAAKLCGLENTLEGGAVRDVLAQFVDYTSSSEWARASLAFCYQEGILSDEEMEILPKAPIKRCEAAEMLFRLLKAARLI